MATTMVCNQKLVIVLADKAPEKSDSGLIELPELVKENMNKRQNRGKIVAIGGEVTFWQVGDYVSFYRNAATPIIHEGIEYLIMRHEMINVKFTEDEQ